MSSETVAETAERIERLTTWALSRIRECEERIAILHLPGRHDTAELSARSAERATLQAVLSCLRGAWS